MGALLSYAAPIVLAVILFLQKTKQAMLPRTQTPVLWAAVSVVLVGVVILRSGWGRAPNGAAAENELGTLANNFYEPRRDALTNGFAVGGGVFGGLLWATATWSVVIGGMRRDVTARGLVDFEVAALAGALTGGVIGAVIGLAVGHWWETRHRRRRLARRASHA